MYLVLPHPELCALSRRWNVGNDWHVYSLTKFHLIFSLAHSLRISLRMFIVLLQPDHHLNCTQNCIIPDRYSHVLMPSGRSGFLWPGLNAPVLKGGMIQTIGQRDKEERVKMQSEIIRRRDEWEKRRKTRVKRERGWTGNSWGGVSIGPPDPGPNGGKKTRKRSPLFHKVKMFNVELI